MASIAEQREALQHRRDEVGRARASVADRVEAARRDLERSQAELQGLSAQEQVLDADVDATARLEQDLADTRATVRGVRSRAEAELSTARDDHQALTARINQELSAERRSTLSRGLDRIDGAIAAAERAAEEAGRRLAESEEAAAEAQRRLDAAAASQAAAVQRLHAVPEAIEAARARVTTARAAAGAAVDAGRMAEAFVRARDLSRALDALDQAVHAIDDQQAAEEIPALWSATLARSSEQTEAAAAVPPLTETAAAALGDRDALMSARERHIEAILSEPPAAQPGEHDEHEHEASDEWTAEPR